jgi:CysZ protein
MNLSTLPSALYGPGYLLQGMRLLRRPGLRRYVVLPLLGNLLVYLIAGVAIFFGLDAALDRWLPEGFAWLRWILFPLIALLLIAAGVFAFTMVAAVLLSPFLGRLAAEVEAMLDGRRQDSGEPWWRELRFSIGVELRRLGYAIACLLAVLLLGLVPMVNIAAPPLAFLVSAWLLAGEYAGNPLGNRLWPLRRQLELLRRHRARVLAFGAASFGLSLVPLVNLVVIPASAVGMTLLCRDLLAAEARSAAAP